MLTKVLGGAIAATALAAAGVALVSPAAAVGSSSPLNLCGKGGLAEDVCGSGTHQVCVVLYKDDGTTQDYCVDWTGATAGASALEQ